MRSVPRLALILVYAVLGLAPALPAHAQQEARGLPTLAPLVNEVTPAVVNVSVVTRSPLEDNPLYRDPFFRRFFGPQFGGPRDQLKRSLGSGVIVDVGGLVVTNNHVIEGADQVKVTLADKREFAVEVVLKDPRTDLAILRPHRDQPPVEHLQFELAIGRLDDAVDVVRRRHVEVLSE